ncbi:MAG: HNH endonuclease [Planctomycetota bacterium]
MSSILSEPTLVLNKSWLPVHVCSARRALVLLYKDMARAMGENFVLHDFASWLGAEVSDQHAYVTTVSRRIRLPEVVVLKSCDRFVQPRVAFSRRNLFRRDQHTCQYCGKKCSTEELSIDHIVPRSRGGPGSWTNCVAACRRCNERKANRTIQQVGMKLLNTPREPPSHMAFTLYMGRQKESWKQFVGSKSS